jgi:hypothetical protein
MNRRDIEKVLNKYWQKENCPCYNIELIDKKDESDLISDLFALYGVSQQRELLIDFMQKLNKAPLAQYMDYGDIVDDYEKGNL